MSRMFHHESTTAHDDPDARAEADDLLDEADDPELNGIDEDDEDDEIEAEAEGAAPAGRTTPSACTSARWAPSRS